MALSKDESSSINKVAKEIHKPLELQPKKGKKVFLISFTIISIIIIAGIGFGYANSKKPAALDNFAKCLSEKDAVMYGASWCKYTQAQKRMFGNSIKFINYKDFTENKEVRKTPTWFINGEKYEDVQSLDKLAALTGCSIS